MNWGFSLPIACTGMLIGISLQSWCPVGITSWRQGIFSAFTFHFDCIGMPSLLGFLIRAGIKCSDFSYPMLNSRLSLFDTKEHCPHSQAYATYLPCCSALVFSSSYCYLLASVPFFHCKVKASRLQKISLALFASQKVWQPSTLFISTPSLFTFPFSVSCKVGIPSFFLEIICLCSFLAHFWIAL